jgi:hypothetical protein
MTSISRTLRREKTNAAVKVANTTLYAPGNFKPNYGKLKIAVTGRGASGNPTTGGNVSANGNYVEAVYANGNVSANGNYVAAVYTAGNVLVQGNYHNAVYANGNLAANGNYVAAVYNNGNLVANGNYVAGNTNAASGGQYIGSVYSFYVQSWNCPQEEVIDGEYTYYIGYDYYEPSWGEASCTQHVMYTYHASYTNAGYTNAPTYNAPYYAAAYTNPATYNPPTYTAAYSNPTYYNPNYYAPAYTNPATYNPPTYTAAYTNPTYYNPTIPGTAASPTNVLGVTFPGGAADSLAPVVPSVYVTVPYTNAGTALTVPPGGYITLAEL